MRILRASDYRVMPWKNGGGTTTEIVVSPEGAALDAFDWRISMARVETDGLFSVFPGIDRTLSILEGEGIDLTIGGNAPVRLNLESEPLSFHADVPTRGDLVAGPIVDLNVMSRRGHTTHFVRRFDIRGALELAVSAQATLVFCHRGRVLASTPDTGVLDALDTLWVGHDCPALRLSAEEPATIFIIQIDAAGRVD